MATNFPVKGYWFLPSNQDHRIAGSLDIDGDRFRLELFGSFNGDSHQAFLSSIEWDKSTITPLILGRGSDGKDYSLLSCISGASSLNFNAEFPLTSYLVDDVLRGCLLDEPDKKIFKKMRIEYSHLQEWLGFTGILPGNFEKSGFTLTYRYPDSIDLTIDDTLRLRFAYQYHYDGPNRYLRKIIQTCFMDIESKNLTSYYDFIKPLNLFQDFLSLATLSTISTKSTTLFSELAESGDVDDVPIKIDLFLSPQTIEQREEKPFLKFLFQYDDVKTILPNTLKKWFAISGEMLPIRRYLVESIKRNNLFEVNNFLNIVQALEGFHSRFRKEEKVFKVWLTNLVVEFSFVELVKTEFYNQDSIIQSIKDSRHYYSHFYRLRNDSTKQGRELFYLTKRLRILLICCVLKEIGFEEFVINNIVKADKL